LFFGRVDLTVTYDASEWGAPKRWRWKVCADVDEAELAIGEMASIGFVIHPNILSLIEGHNTLAFLPIRLIAQLVLDRLVEESLAPE